VTRGVSVTIYNALDGTLKSAAFGGNVVRIGRNVLNDLRLEVPTVSQFHALLELHGETLFIRDLGAKNGVWLPDRTCLAANTATELAPYNGSFYIHPYSIQASVEEVDTSASRREMRAGAPHTERVLEAAPVSTAPDPLDELYDAYRSAWDNLQAKLLEELTAAGPARMEQRASELAARFPAVVNEPEFHKFHEPRKDVPSADPRVERSHVAAANGVRRLVERYLPQQPVRGPEDIDEFVSAVQATLDVFFRCFIPLRDGQKQFQAQMNLEQTARGGGGSQSVNLAAGVDNARNPAELANALLDWRREDTGIAQVESTFADLMIHQVALLNGVMAGIKSLLAELSPQAIERAADDPRRDRGGLQIGPFRYKQLWEIFVERHADFAEEERFAFEVIFGKRFAAAYQQYNAVATVQTSLPPRSIVPPKT